MIDELKDIFWPIVLLCLFVFVLGHLIYQDNAAEQEVRVLMVKPGLGSCSCIVELPDGQRRLMTAYSDTIPIDGERWQIKGNAFIRRLSGAGRP